VRLANHCHIVVIPPGESIINVQPCLYLMCSLTNVEMNGEVEVATFASSRYPELQRATTCAWKTQETRPPSVKIKLLAT
jgi:hypothetical protein